MFEPERTESFWSTGHGYNQKGRDIKYIGPPKLDKHLALMVFFGAAKRSHAILRNALTKENAAESVTSP